jgi:hypothetical protein
MYVRMYERDRADDVRVVRQVSLKMKYTVVLTSHTENVTILDSVVIIVTGLRPRQTMNSGSIPDWNNKIWSNDTDVFSRGVKRQGHETELSASTNAQIKNEWRYKSTPPLCLHGVHRNTLTLLLFVVSYILHKFMRNTCNYARARARARVCVYKHVLH